MGPRESPSRVMRFPAAFQPRLRNACGSSSHHLGIRVVFSLLRNLSSCLSRAAITAADEAESSAEDGARSSLYFTAGTSM